MGSGARKSQKLGERTEKKENRKTKKQRKKTQGLEGQGSVLKTEYGTWSCKIVC